MGTPSKQLERPGTLFMILVLVWLSLFVLRYTAPSDLLDKDQERPAAYMADAALNGNWVVQVDDHGRVCSKPPVYTWLGAGLIVATGRISEFALYFPSAVGVLGCCCLMWIYGARRFGHQAAFLGAACLLLSTIGIRILYLARTDALFSFTTFLTACIGFSCRQNGLSWIYFWIAATLATLTKGPLGLVLACGGLIGLRGQAKPAGPHPHARLHNFIGFSIYIIISVGWIWLAYRQLGDAVLAKLIGKELYGHTNWASERFSIDLFFFVTPTLFFISRFFPWSLPAIIGVWRVWRRPAEDLKQRSFERFLCGYLCCGIALFSIFPHQRPDHLFPLLPAAALLAGRQIQDWFATRQRQRAAVPAMLLFWLVFLVGFGVYYFKIDPATNAWFAKTAAVRNLADRYRQIQVGTDALHFVDVPYGLQFHLNTMKQRISYQSAAALLQADAPAVVVVKSLHDLKNYLPPKTALNIVMRWPETGEGEIFFVSSHP